MEKGTSFRARTPVGRSGSHVNPAVDGSNSKDPDQADTGRGKLPSTLDKIAIFGLVLALVAILVVLPQLQTPVRLVSLLICSVAICLCWMFWRSTIRWRRSSIAFAGLVALIAAGVLVVDLTSNPDEPSHAARQPDGNVANPAQPYENQIIADALDLKQYYVSNGVRHYLVNEQVRNCVHRDMRVIGPWATVPHRDIVSLREGVRGHCPYEEVGINFVRERGQQQIWLVSVDHGEGIKRPVTRLCTDRPDVVGSGRYDVAAVDPGETAGHREVMNSPFIGDDDGPRCRALPG